MPVKKLKEFLDRHNVKYINILHSRAYTAQEIAASAHVPGREMAKSVMVKLDGKLAMAVIPASRQIDFKQLKAGIGVDSAELAGEEEFKDQFPECELGAMPPFGNLYGIEVYVSRELNKYPDIAFNAGSHTELMRMAYEDFRRLASPNLIEL